MTTQAHENLNEILEQANQGPELVPILKRFENAVDILTYHDIAKALIDAQNATCQYLGAQLNRKAVGQ